jgi:hypothetical protein
VAPRDYSTPCPNQSARTKAYLDPSEVESLEKHATNLRDRLLIRLLFHLGCRVSETLADEKGEAIIPADTDGQGCVRIDGKYLAQAPKACGGMVDFKLTNAYSPMLWTAPL